MGRLSDQAIREVVGDAGFEQLVRKSRGGKNGFKGFKYEHLFGAHRIARLAQKLLTNKEDAEVEWQSFGFVDDFVVRRDASKSFKGYQAKNSSSVSWTAGDWPIAKDFELQFQLATLEGYTDVRLRVVCSDETVCGNLNGALPENISHCSKAIYFPFAESAMFVILEKNDWLRDDFAFLSRLESPRITDVMDVAGVLMGAWDLLSPKATVSAVLDQARKTSPLVIRSLMSDDEARQQLSGPFRKTLDGFSDFEWRVVRGFLSWSAYGGTMAGTLSIDCFDPKFKQWQQHIIDKQPKRFSDVEGAFI